MRWNLYTVVPLFVALSLMSGCMGLGDLFAQRRTIAGDFRLQRFEGGDLYLMVSGESGSVAGPISRIGWNKNFIVLAPNNNDATDILVIHVHDRRILKGEELKDFRLRVAPGIALVNVQEAWKDLRH